MSYEMWLVDVRKVENLESGKIGIRHTGKPARYARAHDRLADILGSAQPLAYKGPTQEVDSRDTVIHVSELVLWWHEEDRPYGIYAAIEVAYSLDGTFLGGSLFCYYDGLHPDSGKRLKSIEDAKAYAASKHYILVD